MIPATRGSAYFFFLAAGLDFERDAALAGLLAFFGAAFTDLLAGFGAAFGAGFATFFAGAAAAFFAGAACDVCAACVTCGACDGAA